MLHLNGFSLYIPPEGMQQFINNLNPPMDYSSIRIEPELKPGDLKKNYEPGINRGNIAYETFCKHIERWLQNGTLKIGEKNDW